MVTLAVTPAAIPERPQVVSTIVLAFVRDPVTRWVWRDPHQYLIHFPRFVEAFGGRAFAHGSAHRSEEFLGAALWLPPGVQPDEDTMVGMIDSTVDPARVPTVFRIFEQMGRYHPAEPHWYLPLIGVEPLMQGRGYADGSSCQCRSAPRRSRGVAGQSQSRLLLTPRRFRLDIGIIQKYIEYMRQTSKPRNLGRHELKVADEVWMATALLHRENPDRGDFTVAEIVERARREELTPELRPGVYVHAVLHSVANRSPNPGRYRMLFETAQNRRRLYRPGDPAHEARRGAKMTPSRSAIPPKYHPLLDWYEREYASQRGLRPEADPLLALRGSGRELWAKEHADQYIRRLREGWE